MKVLKNGGVLAVAVIMLVSCNFESNKTEIKLDTPKAFDVQIAGAINQLDALRDKAIKNKRIPRTLNEDGTIHWAHKNFDWTQGFFPGSMWMAYKYTNDDKWKNAAKELQSLFDEDRFLTTNHDLGFVFNCSYGNGFKITSNEKYKSFLIDASNSLITRFNPNVGCIKSWDVNGGWQATRGWKFPVIIDNMMNLELLFRVSELTGDDKYKDIAITHANTTLKNHFREDWSSFHVVDYDPDNGKVRHKHTAQGYAHESSWARGQAWGLYGFTVCYRYTKDPKYLEVAENIAGFILNHENLPEDLIPYWDFDAPKIPDEPRDVSAATIIASALIELDGYSSVNYEKTACEILENLSTPKYKAELDENQNFILKHSVGSIPHNAEIDVPLNYADYYYLEAMLRMGKRLAIKN